MFGFTILSVILTEEGKYYAVRQKYSENRYDVSGLTHYSSVMMFLFQTQFSHLFFYVAKQYALGTCYIESFYTATSIVHDQ